MQMAGATARQMHEAAAAQTSNVAVGECQAQSGFVAHGLSGRKLAFGDLAKVAALLPVPRSSEVRLKERKDWRYIGKPHAIVDLKDIVRGRASYGIDVVVPGMKYASLASGSPARRQPSFGRCTDIGGARHVGSVRLVFGPDCRSAAARPIAGVCPRPRKISARCRA